MLDERQQVLQKLQDINFEDRNLPADTQPLNDTALQYLEDRCIPRDYPLLYKTMPRPGILIPFTHNGQVVGHTTRFLDDRTPKYIQDIQHGYVFGTDLQKNSWQHAIVVEGVFDALSIGGLAVLHAEINDAQVRLIRSLGREITVVPDQDEAGLKLVDRAIELGWAVSMPSWGADVKDVNDSVKKYGRTTTMLSIFEARNTSRIKIEIARNNLLRKIHG